MNGARTGMGAIITAIRRPSIRRDRRVAPAAWYGAAAGLAAPSVVACRTGAAAIPSIASAIVASAWPAAANNNVR